MKDRPNRSTRAVTPSGRPRAPQRVGGRAPAQRGNARNRQILAVGALFLVIAVIVGIVYLTRPNQPSSSGTAGLTGSLPNEAVGHARGSETASVVVTEWSDFQ